MLGLKLVHVSKKKPATTGQEFEYLRSIKIYHDMLSSKNKRYCSAELYKIEKNAGWNLQSMLQYLMQIAWDMVLRVLISLGYIIHSSSLISQKSIVFARHLAKGDDQTCNMFIKLEERIIINPKLHALISPGILQTLTPWQLGNAAGICNLKKNLLSRISIWNFLQCIRMLLMISSPVYCWL